MVGVANAWQRDFEFYVTVLNAKEKEYEYIVISTSILGLNHLAILTKLDRYATADPGCDSTQNLKSPFSYLHIAVQAPVQYESYRHLLEPDESYSNPLFQSVIM